ncbi:hypothetical protein BH10BAC4_BH10BAC4_26610 [soil metagenome]
MKKLILLAATVFASVSLSVAQKSKTTTTKPQTQPQTQPVQEEAKTQPAADQKMIEHFVRKYSFASRWNDMEVAKDALYDLIVEYPGSDSLIYALALDYYQNEKYPSAVLVGQDLLNRTPKNPRVLELVAAGYELLNITDRALQNYESLFLVTSNNLTLYKMAFLQYTLKRYPECITNADILLAKPEIDTLKVSYNDAQGKPKEYILKVALLNLKGLVYKDQSDKVNAKKFFDQALALAPDFVAAKENLASLK